MQYVSICATETLACIQLVDTISKLLRGQVLADKNGECREMKNSHKLSQKDYICGSNNMDIYFPLAVSNSM